MGIDTKRTTTTKKNPTTTTMVVIATEKKKKKRANNTTPSSTSPGNKVLGTSSKKRRTVRPSNCRWKYPELAATRVISPSRSSTGPSFGSAGNVPRWDRRRQGGDNAGAEYPHTIMIPSSKHYSNSTATTETSNKSQ